MSNNRDFVALTIVVAAYFLAFSTSMRVPLGLLLLLFLPGYVWSVALFPRQSAITGIERLGISVAASIALVSVIGVLLHYLGVAFGLRPILLSELGFILAGMLVGVWQRRRYGADAYQPQLRSAYRPLAVGLFVTGIIVASVLSVERPQSATEFYFTEATALPRQATVGRALAIDLTVVNKEDLPQSYHYEVWVEDSWSERVERILTGDTFDLAPATMHTDVITWQMPIVGGDQQVHFYLFRNDETQPHRQLTLWIDVNE